MTLKAVLTDPNTNSSLQAEPITGSRGRRVLITERIGRVRGSFRSVTNTGAQTQTIAEPSAAGAIVLTDLILSSDKTQSATVVLQFTDGTETEVLFSGDASNNTINIAIAFQGHWQGWAGARLELVTDTLNQEVTAAVGYYKVGQDEALNYSAWDEDR